LAENEKEPQSRPLTGLQNNNIPFFSSNHSATLAITCTANNTNITPHSIIEGHIKHPLDLQFSSKSKMAPRSQLEIVTSSVLRLVKEEASYHKELQQQTERVKKLEAETGGDDENREFTIKQEVCTSSIASNCSTIIAYAN
jgi:hypothetical protein